METQLRRFGHVQRVDGGYKQKNFLHLDAIKYMLSKK